MSSIPNPFIFGGPVPPDEFFGRRHEVDFMLDRLYGRSRSSIAIWGDRRVGKTSLLHFIMQPGQRAQWVAEPERHFMVFVDCQRFSHFSWKGFWEIVLDEALLAAEHSPLPTALPWRQQAEKLLEKEQLSERQVRLFFRRMQNEGQTLTLLLDEFTNLLEVGTADNLRELQGLLNFLRTLITDVQPTSPHPRPLTLVISTRRPLNEVCQPVYGEKDISRFDNPFVFERLKPFTEEDVAQLIAHKTAGTGIQFTPEEITRLLETVGRHPLLVQAYAAELFAGKQRPPDDWRTTLLNNQFMRRNQQHFRDLWHYSSPAEQQFLVALIRQELPQQLSSSERKARNDLLERGLISREEGALRPFSALFASWLRLNLNELTDTQITPKVNLGSLRQVLSEGLSLTELQTLCFDLDINYDGLSGDNMHLKIVALLEYTEKRQRTAEVLAWLDTQRPDLTF